MFFKSIDDADKVIVQTKWMKEACLQKTNADPNKFEVKQPDVNIKVKKYYEQENEDFKLFFYPASGFEYKNHRIIVAAAKKLIEHGVTNFKIVFTLKDNENGHVKNLYQTVKKENLPIDFIGRISLDEVYDYYSKSILIFPSYIETFGLPLLEAKMHKSPILSSDCAFSHEILDGYDRVRFFDPFDHHQLCTLMGKAIEY